MKKFLTRFATNESGATAIEYGLIAAGVGIAIVTVVGEVGTELTNMFGTVKTGLQ